MPDIKTIFRDQGLWLADREGVDCSGETDASADLQTLIDGIPNGSTILFPKLADGSDRRMLMNNSVNIIGRQGIKLASYANRSGGAAEGESPAFTWNGTDHGKILKFDSSLGCGVENLGFETGDGKVCDGYIEFDGDGNGSTPTEYFVRNCVMASPGENNDWKGIAISETSSNNHEYCIIENNRIFGSGETVLRSRAASIASGDATLSGATGATFVDPDDVGKRIRLSWVGGNFGWDDENPVTITAVNSATSVEMSDMPDDTKSNVTVHVGERFGTCIYQGASSNAKENRFLGNTCGFAKNSIVIMNGSFELVHHRGGYTDCCLYIGNLAEASSIKHMDSEGTIRLIHAANIPSQWTVEHSRYANANQRADGFIYFEGGAHVIFSGNDGAQTLSNTALFGYGGVPTLPRVTSIANIYPPRSQTNLSPLMTGDISHPLRSLGDSFDADGNLDFVGSALGIPVITASATGPGAGALKIEVVDGTTGGKAKVTALAGTSGTPSTIEDDVGSGV